MTYFLAIAWQLFEPHILEIIGSILMLVMTFAGARFTQWTGIQISEKAKNDLHSALISGVEQAMLHGPADGMEHVIESAIDYAKESVPDALNRLKPSPRVLRTLAARYIKQSLDFGN